jgi:hypothetical protein
VKTFGLLYYFLKELLASSAGFISWFFLLAGAFLAVTGAGTLLGLPSLAF